MTDAQSRRETETEVLPHVDGSEGLARTRELPVVEEGAGPSEPPVEDATEQVVRPVGDSAATVPAQQPVPSPPLQSPVQSPPVQSPPVQSPPVQSPPVQSPPVQSPPVQSPSLQQPRLQQQPPTSQPPRPPVPAEPGRRHGNRMVALVAAALALIVISGAVVVHGWNLGSGAGNATGAANAAPLRATISSFDPSGGSGFRPVGDTTWRTQTYQSAEFGNLKNGVGLLLDLGAPRAVGAVTFTAVDGPIAVELRAGDDRAASQSGYSRVAADGGASGSTTFTVKDGAKHRYWLIWVTRLADQGGGYRAIIRDPAVRGAG